ncbi:integral membrane protein [Gossypium australe]|uniref:Integral membrane protein n=1 Tax=Gossypium australe TaxID=47621 RepID=A0A5B6VFY5_9ROSI|nr:integral membrane protein [Gossypium australe]
MASQVLSTTLLTPICSSTTFNKTKIKPSTNQAKPFLFSPSSSSLGFRNRKIKCNAVSESSQGSIDRTVYQGAFGPWTIDPEDVREGMGPKKGIRPVDPGIGTDRSGLVTAASSFVIASSAAFLPDNFTLKEIIENNLNLIYLIGAGGLGLSLYLIHIYITELKRTLQAFWALGVVGSLATYLALAQPAGENLVQYVIENPMAVWFVGPLFAALTGLVFKEGLCYGKLEAGILTFIIPTLLLGHLTGLMDDGTKLTLLGSWMALFVIFAGRKFTQPVKDDIGDKSVFVFNSLPEDKKEALIEKLEKQKLQSDSQF